MQWARGNDDDSGPSCFWRASGPASWRRPWPANGATEERGRRASARQACGERRRPGPARARSTPATSALPADLRAAGGRRPRRRRSADRRARRSAPARPRALAALPAPDRPSLDLRRARGLARAVCRPPGRRPDLPARAAPAARRRRRGRPRPLPGYLGGSGQERAGAGRGSATGPTWSARAPRRRPCDALARGDRAAGRRRSAGARRAARLQRPEIMALIDPVEADLARWTVARGYLSAGEHRQGAGARRPGRRALRPRRPGDPLDRRDQRLAPRPRSSSRPGTSRRWPSAASTLARRALARGVLGGARLPGRLQAAAGPATTCGSPPPGAISTACWRGPCSARPPGHDGQTRSAATTRAARSCCASPAPGARWRSARSARSSAPSRRSASSPAAPRPSVMVGLIALAERLDLPAAQMRLAQSLDGPRGRLPLRRPLPGAELAAGQRLLRRPGAGLLDHARRVRPSIRRPRATPAPRA